MTAITNGAIITPHCMVAGSVDAYSGALPGLQLDVVRTGVGFGPNTTRSVSFSDVTVSSGEIGFPILGRTNVADDRVIAALVTAAPPGSRWCEVDLEPGTVLLYGPGSEHTGVDFAGLEFVFTTVALESLDEAVDRLQLGQPRVSRGHVQSLAPSTDMLFLANLLRSIQRQLLSEGLAATVRRDMLEALGFVLSTGSSFGGAKRRRRIDNREIVRRCVQYAEAVGRNPSIIELSRAAFVSERRLREAFTSTLSMPPRQYFQHRILNEARRRLVAGNEEQVTVSRVAADLGFSHFGRFSSAYSRIYGELPSGTLAAHNETTLLATGCAEGAGLASPLSPGAGNRAETG